MRPFNLQEALANPTKVRHRDGTRAVYIHHFPTANWSSRVVVQFQDGAVVTYSESGQMYYEKQPPSLFLAPEPEQVPFTVEGFEKGWEPIYRNGEKPVEVHVFKKMPAGNPFNVFSINSIGISFQHTKDGCVYGGNSIRDLFLIKPAT